MQTGKKVDGGRSNFFFFRKQLKSRRKHIRRSFSQTAIFSILLPLFKASILIDILLRILRQKSFVS